MSDKIKVGDKVKVAHGWLKHLGFTSLERDQSFEVLNIQDFDADGAVYHLKASGRPNLYVSSLRGVTKVENEKG